VRMTFAEHKAEIRARLKRRERDPLGGKSEPRARARDSIRQNDQSWRALPSRPDQRAALVVTCGGGGCRRSQIEVSGSDSRSGYGDVSRRRPSRTTGHTGPYHGGSIGLRLGRDVEAG
jgi:hypothetical protein